MDTLIPPADSFPGHRPAPTAGSTLRDLPARERPRERMARSGPGHLSDVELLAVMLGRGIAGLSALDLARSLLARFGTIRGVLNARPGELESLRGMGPGKAAVLTAARECCCRYMAEKLAPGRSIGSPADSQDFLLARLRDRPHEVFCCLFLDNRHRVLAFEELFRGTIDSTTVYPREVVCQALHRNAAAVILAHNHPSGVAEPSEADRIITRRIRDALDLVDVRLLDHFVVGDGTCISLAARGLLQEGPVGCLGTGPAGINAGLFPPPDPDGRPHPGATASCGFQEKPSKSEFYQGPARFRRRGRCQRAPPCPGSAR